MIVGSAVGGIVFLALVTLGVIAAVCYKIRSRSSSHLDSKIEYVENSCYNVTTSDLPIVECPAYGVTNRTSEIYARIESVEEHTYEVVTAQ